MSFGQIRQAPHSRHSLRSQSPEQHPQRATSGIPPNTIKEAVTVRTLIRSAAILLALFGSLAIVPKAKAGANPDVHLASMSCPRRNHRAVRR